MPAKPTALAVATAWSVPRRTRMRISNRFSKYTWAMYPESVHDPP